MTPETIIETKCSRCGGSGKIRPYRAGRPGKMPLVPCVACEQRGSSTVARSVLDRCINMLGDEPEYHRPRAGRAMAEWAIRFAEKTPWAGIVQAIAVAYQCPEFHPAATARRAKAKRREDWAGRMRWIPKPPTRRELAQRLAKSRGMNVWQMCLASYRRGAFSPTLFGLLTPGERSAMVMRLGFTAHGHAAILGVTPANMPRRVTL